MPSAIEVNSSQKFSLKNVNLCIFWIFEKFDFLWSFNIKATFITSNVHLLMQGHRQKVKSPKKEKEKEEETKFPLAYLCGGQKLKDFSKTSEILQNSRKSSKNN